LAEGILNSAHFSLQGIWALLEKLAALPYHLVQLTSISWLIIIASGLSVLLLLSPKGIPGRHFGWIALIPLFLHQVKPISYGCIRFTLLDVGQGLSAVIQTQHHTLLYDAGPEYGKAGDAGQRVIKPFLKANQISKLDKIVISHSDLDHRGGLKSLSDVTAGEILTSEPQRLRLPAEQCIAGQSWEWDGVVFQMLGPSSLEVKKRNDLSCVLKVSTPSHSILLTGDIEKGAEEAMRQRYEDELKSTILVVPHHGSLTSSTDDFIRAVSPEYALYPVGKDNHYGFPRAQIVARYQEMGCQSFISWQSGALSFLVPASGPVAKPLAYRQQSQRFWFSPSS
jgi:competence protein ComEC